MQTTHRLIWNELGRSEPRSKEIVAKDDDEASSEALHHLQSSYGGTMNTKVMAPELWNATTQTQIPFSLLASVS